MVKATTRISLIYLALFVLAAHGSSSCGTQRLSYFRSNHGVAIPDDCQLCVDFRTQQLAWRKSVGPGCSTPCVVDNLIVVTTFEDGRLFTVALDLSDGVEQWRQEVPATQIEPFHNTGSAAVATPASNGEEIFAFFGSYGMLCYDRQGQLQWSRPFKSFQDEWGAASSPILVDETVIINQDHDVNSFLIALDQKTGQTTWQTDRAEFTRSYATPIVWQGSTTTHVVVAGALQLVAYNTSDGGREWSLGGLSRIVNPTPVIARNRIYVATWSPWVEGGDRFQMQPWTDALLEWDTNGDSQLAHSELPNDPVGGDFVRIDLNKNGTLNQSEWEKHANVFAQAENSVMAIHPAPAGLARPRILWKHKRGQPYVASPLVYREVVYTVKDGGIVTTWEADSGKMLKRGRIRGKGRYFASPVAGDGKVYLASERGFMTIIKAGKKWEIISSHDFRERITATPVLIEGQVLIRTEDALYCFRSEPSKALDGEPYRTR